MTDVQRFDTARRTGSFAVALDFRRLRHLPLACELAGLFWVLRCFVLLAFA